MFEKQVPIDEAKCVVFIDFVDSNMEGYANLEDAHEALELRKTDGASGFHHHLAEIKKTIYVDRND